MVFHTKIGILLASIVAVAMALQEDCGNDYYGTCDPGPGCFNWDPNKEQFRCLNCYDGGFFPWDFRCDGKTDCYNGSDEKYCKNKYFRTKTASCFPFQHPCSQDSKCCSNICTLGICTF